MKKIKVCPGVNLTAVYTDKSKFKTETLTAAYVIPLKEETAASASLLPSVLRRGTAKYPDMLSLMKKLDYLYAASMSPLGGKVGESQTLGFRTEFLREDLVPQETDLFGETVSLMSELLYSPALSDGAFVPEYVESEKKNLLDSVKALINNKNAYAYRKMTELMCAGENYSVCELGTEKTISEITAQSLFRFWKNVTATAPLEVFYVGSLDAEAVAEKLKAAIPERSSGGFSLPVCETKLIKTVKSAKEYTEKMPVNQGKISMGFRTGGSAADGNAPVYILMNAVFGGGVTSKLFLNVREKMSLCYYCSSSFDADKGVIAVNSGINVGNCEKTKTEILRQLDLMKSGEITDSEITDAKKALANSYMEVYDDPDSLVAWYKRFAVRGAAPVEPREYMEAVNAVTKEEVIEAAKTVTLDTFYFLEGTEKASDNDGEENEA